MCPEEKCSPSCENARKSVSYKLTVRKTAKMPCLAKFLFFYSRWLLKKQSTQIKEHFSSSTSGFIDRHKSNNRQWPNWERNPTYTQPNGTLLFLIGAAGYVQRSRENCDFVTLQHAKVAPANGGNEQSEFARKNFLFWFCLKLGRRAHHGRFFPTLNIILAQTSLRRQLSKVSHIRNGIHCIFHSKMASAATVSQKCDWAVC